MKNQAMNDIYKTVGEYRCSQPKMWAIAPFSQSRGMVQAEELSDRIKKADIGVLRVPWTRINTLL